MKYLLLITLLHIVHLSPGQGVWDGGAGTTKWNDKGNWDDDTVPTPTTNVLIDGTFTVELDVHGFCASLELREKSTLNIGDAILQIDQIPSDNFHVKIGTEAVLTNNGHLDISNKKDTVIINTGRIINNASVTIENASVRILNEEKGTFSNFGELNILKSRRGINNLGVFLNENEIQIDSIDTDGYGIGNNSEFINSNSGIITIKKANNNSSGISIYSIGTLTNSGIISIEQAYVGIIVYGEMINSNAISIEETERNPVLNDGGTITNTINGSIIIEKNSEDNTPGIWNKQNSSIKNEGTISIDSITGHGLINEGSCTFEGNFILKNCGRGINNFGVITNKFSFSIINTGSDVISNRPQGSIINESNGSILLKTTSATGIVNFSEFINYGKITIDSANSLALYNGVSWNNMGELKIQNCGQGISNDGTFNNEDSISIINSDRTPFTNFGVFTNTSNGFIAILKNKEDNQPGIRNYQILPRSPGVIINEGYISVDSIKGVGVDNQSFFNNIGTLEINSFQSTGIYNRDTLLNDGIISLISNNFVTLIRSDFSSSYIENNGLIDGKNAFEGINNYGLLKNTNEIKFENIIGIGIRIRESGIFDQEATGTLLLQNITGDYFEVSSGAEVNILGQVTFD